MALCRQQAQTELVQRQAASRVIQHCYQRFVVRRQLRLPKLAQACAVAVATLDVVKVTAASLPADSNNFVNNFNVWMAENRHHHAIYMFDSEVQFI